MSLEFVNRICPKCKNPNYMVSLGDFSTAYKYKCMNCNGYFNDIDFSELPQFVGQKERMNQKADMVEVVRCKDCIHLNAPANGVPFCKHIKKFVDADWFCADGERR